MSGQKRPGQGGPDDGGPADPITELAAAAAGLHELKLAYVGAGFTEGQAMTLCSTIIYGGIRNANGNGGGE